MHTLQLSRQLSACFAACSCPQHLCETSLDLDASLERNGHDRDAHAPSQMYSAITSTLHGTV